MNWGLKKIRTLPLDGVDEFLTHVIERNSVEEAIESSLVLQTKYGLTDEINKLEQNENYNFEKHLLKTPFIQLNIENLIKEY